MQAIEIHILSMYCVRLTHDSMAKHACTGFYTYFNKKNKNMEKSLQLMDIVI